MTVPDESVQRRLSYLERRIRELEFALDQSAHMPRTMLQLNSRLWRFKLNEAFTDGSADADLLTLSGVDTELDVEVKDPLLIFQTLGVTTDDEGYCLEQLDMDGTRWFLVIQMECP